MSVSFLQREYNAGIPGMLISTSCVFGPSLGRTSCLMRLRSSLALTGWALIPTKTLMPSFFVFAMSVGRGKSISLVLSEDNWKLWMCTFVLFFISEKEKKTDREQRWMLVGWSKSVCTWWQGSCWMCSFVYSMSLPFVVHKNRKIKVLEGVGSVAPHRCLCNPFKRLPFPHCTTHQGIQTRPKHRQLHQRYVFSGRLWQLDDFAGQCCLSSSPPCFYCLIPGQKQK